MMYPRVLLSCGITTWKTAGVSTNYNLFTSLVTIINYRGFE